MPRSTLVRRSQDSQGKGSKKLPAQPKQPTRAVKGRKQNVAVESVEEEVEEGGDEELFKVEKIVDHKLDKYGVPLYKTRWKGYSASDDTWEPTANVASTGHVDRYERLLRQKTLTEGSEGVAVIEYEDGEREMVDMKMEKFRSWQDSDSGDEDDRDDDTVNGDSDINDLRLIVQGEWIEILWKNASIYFPCKIISWTPISAKKSQQRKENSKKRAFDEDESKKPTKSKLSQPKEQPKEHMKVSAKPKSTKRVFEDVKESAETKPKSTKRVFNDAKEPTKPNSAQIKRRQTDPPPLSTKQGHEVTTSRGKRQPKNAEPELPLFPPLLPPFQNVLDNHFYSSNSSEISTDDESDRPVDRDGHGIPLYNEPEGDFDSSDDDVSDDDDNDDDDREGTYQHRCLSEVRPKLSFEELWTLKLKRTQELMSRGGSQSNGIS